MQETIKRVLVASCAFVFICLNGCGKHDKKGHDATVQFGQNSQPLVQQFNALTPEDGRRHWIGYFDGYAGVPTWNSFAKLHGRYKLTMQFQVTLDRGSQEFSPKSQPRFYVWEVTEVDVPASADSGIGCKFGKQFSFGVDRWEKLVDSDGDFSAIGIELKKDSPVDGFERVMQ